MDWVFEIAKEYGLFAALVAYVLWDSRTRELRYNSLLEKLSKNFATLSKHFDTLSRDVELIRGIIESKEKE